MRQAQFLKLTTIGSLVAALHGPGPTRGRRKLARILATGAAPTQSELEDAVLDLVLRAGSPIPLSMRRCTSTGGASCPTCAGHVSAW